MTDNEFLALAIEQLRDIREELCGCLSDDEQRILDTKLYERIVP
jgi:hypothetical protein